VALDGLAQAENVGGIARSAAAFGADCLLIGETCSPPWVRRTVRASMGTLLDLTVVPSTHLADDLRRLQAQGVACTVADAHGSVPLTSLPLTGDVCLVFGSEGAGVRPEVRDACGTSASIAMAPGIDSLNVAAAAAVFLYETSRQRGTVAPPPAANGTESLHAPCPPGPLRVHLSNGTEGKTRAATEARGLPWRAPLRRRRLRVAYTRAVGRGGAWAVPRRRRSDALHPSPNTGVLV
jgi:tRNA(Leu) C34 or U34 (ribose-2'-O)-methylase TrmL